MKKVLFVISYLCKGGAERALSNITTHFPEDYEIEILVNNDKAIDYPYRGKIISLQINETPNTNSVLFQFKVLFKRIRRLWILKRENKYDACISFLDSANIANILSGRRKCKVIVSVRASLLEQSKLPQYKYVVNPLVKILYNHADKIVAVSEGIRKELINNYSLNEKKVVTIRNGYDVPEIRKKATVTLDYHEETFFCDNKVVVTMGRLTEQKGQWHLIRAFREVVEEVPQARLLILGTGHLEEKMKNLVEEFNLKDQVIFKGYIKNPYQYVALSKVFVLPSMYEGFPNALAEAVCLGIPCIATDFRTGAREILAPEMEELGETIKEMVESEYGILTPLCSGNQYIGREPLEYQEQCLARAILMLLQNSQKRSEYIKKSQLRSRDLGIDEVVRKWINIVDEQ